MHVLHIEREERFKEKKRVIDGITRILNAKGDPTPFILSEIFLQD